MACYITHLECGLLLRQNAAELRLPGIPDRSKWTLQLREVSVSVFSLEIDYLQLMHTVTCNDGSLGSNNQFGMGANSVRVCAVDADIGGYWLLL